MKKIKIAVLLLASFTLLAGCGNTSDKTSENKEQDIITSQSETVSEDAELNIRICIFSEKGYYDDCYRIL